MKNSTDQLLKEIKAERRKLPPGNKDTTPTTTEMVVPRVMEIRVLNTRHSRAVLPATVSRK